MNKLKKIKKKHSGRNISGKVVVRHQGGQQKRFLRLIDFKRDKIGVQGTVIAIEYDPNRSSDIALIHYTDGDKRYILSPEGLQIGNTVLAGKDVEIKIGNALPMDVLPLGTVIHNIELSPGKGGQMARSAGTSAVIQAREGAYVHLKLPSGEIRKIRSIGMATVGQLGNIDWKNEFFGKAGRKRHMGIRPSVRGKAMNPVDHPHGGGEGQNPIGMKYPKTPWGKHALGVKTRRKKMGSTKFIIKRRTK